MSNAVHNVLWQVIHVWHYATATTSIFIIVTIFFFLESLFCTCKRVNNYVCPCVCVCEKQKKKRKVKRIYFKLITVNSTDYIE